MEALKKRVLIIMGRYLPGYKDGGPVRSMKNLTDYLGDEYDFFVLTCDRDHGDKQTYQDIKVGEWNSVGKAQVYYVPPKGFTFSVIRKIIKTVDIVYVCGCFNDYAIKTLLLKRIGIIKKTVIVAAMGLFSPMEFRLKYKKKKLFTTVFNLLGMFKHIYWSATSEMEIAEICQQVKANRNQFFIAEDLPRLVDSELISKNKVENVLDVVWISRIAPKKNLIKAIDILKHVKSRVNFTIYGPIHVEEYWEQCKNKLNDLPENIKWEYKGNVDSEKVVQKLSQYHVFLFPTLGENYGHVIQEALSAGCICVLSDQTPWLDLEEKEVGCVFPLDQTDKFSEAIDKYAKLSREEIQALANNAHQYALELSNKKVENTGYRKIFEL